MGIISAIQMIGITAVIIFPEYNVRFVAISDNVDSAEGLSDLLPFSNLINEWYAKDISKKMRAMITQKLSLIHILVVRGKWKPTRIEYGDNWYLVGIRAEDLNGLRVRI